MWSIPVAGNCFPVRPPPHAFCPVIRLLEIVYINWALEIRFDPVCLFLFLPPRYFSESRLLILSLPSSTVSQSLPSAIAETHFSLTRLINVRRSRYRVSRFATDTNFFHRRPRLSTLSFSLFPSFSLFSSLEITHALARTLWNGGRIPAYPSKQLSDSLCRCFLVLLSILSSRAVRNKGEVPLFPSPPSPSPPPQPAPFSALSRPFFLLLLLRRSRPRRQRSFLMHSLRNAKSRDLFYSRITWLHRGGRLVNNNARCGGKENRLAKGSPPVDR